MPMFHYVSGVYCYLYFDQMHVNLIWYLYPFMLNKICLSLSLKINLTIVIMIIFKLFIGP